MAELSNITIRAPDDWHCHLRDGAKLGRTVTDSASQFRRAIVMPNLLPAITTLAQAMQYKQRIMQNCPPQAKFTPLMTLYLTDNMTVQTVQAAAKSDFIYACKLYPAGATTHSDAGVTELEKIYPLLEAMQQGELILCIHAETTDATVDVFDRERVFIERYLPDIITNFPKLRIVLEHISSEFAVKFVRCAPPNLAATITPHHLLLNRNDLLVGGLKPHHYCLPVIKRAHDQAALIKAATSGDAKFFLGTDSAPHSITSKQSGCGCAGIYSAYTALELYASVFEQHQALDNLEAFASINGANFYNLPINEELITLRKTSWMVPDSLSFASSQLVPLMAGYKLAWKKV